MRECMYFIVIHASHQVDHFGLYVLPNLTSIFSDLFINMKFHNTLQR